jgi:Flp pilus assembly protein TadB
LHDVGLLFAIDRNLMRMYVILALAALLIIGLAFLAVHYASTRQRARAARKQQAVADRLDAVVAQAEQEQKERKAAAKASAALTEVLPAIKQGDQTPRRVA